MRCCFSSGVLTRAEREAIARLREQRAQGQIPTPSSQVTSTERTDPFVTFYSKQPVVPRGIGVNASKIASSFTSLPHKPKHRPVHKQPPSPYRTAHQKKKAIRRAGRVSASRPAITSGTQRSSTSSTVPWVQKISALRERIVKSSNETHDDLDSEQNKLMVNIKPQQLWHNLVDKSRKHGTASASASGSGTGTGTVTTDTDKGSRSRVRGIESESEDEIYQKKQEVDKENNVGRIKWQTKKKLDDVRKLFSNSNSAKGERFVLNSKPELSDLQEASDDRYFQELMKSDT